MLRIDKSIDPNGLADLRGCSKVLHITHTEIPTDNRILKQINALANWPDYELHGLGVSLGVGAQKTNIMPRARIVSLKLLTRSMNFLPRQIRHLAVAVEMSARFLLLGIKIRPDVVHCHDAPVLLVGFFLKHLCKAKLVYDAHELESNKNAQSRSIAWLTLRVERLVWSSIDHVISVSPSILKWYEQHLGPKPNTLILNSPIYSCAVAVSDEEYIKPRHFHEKFHIPFSTKVFLYLGLLVPGRGIETMLEAI